MSKKNTYRLPFLLATALALGLLLGYAYQSSSPLIVVGDAKEGGALRNDGLEEILRYVDARYVDAPDTDAIREAAILAALEQLDPHSSFIPADQVRAVQESMRGDFDGVGIEYLVVDDTITVVSALPGGPSDRAGIQSGDQVIRVGDSLVTGVFARRIDPASLMRGEKGSEVELFIRRGSTDELERFVVERGEIPVVSVEAAYLLDPRTAYVKINRFSEKTRDEFVKALEAQLEKKDAYNVMIDLRDNPGGYLEQATELLSQLFPRKGILLVYTEGRNSQRVEYKTNGRALYNIQKVAILVDEGSASASEIVAGAVQDHDRGIVVGRRTFGKGLVQEQYALSDSSALRLTVARYYTPSGRSIQRSYDDGEAAYRNEIGDRYESGELTGTDDFQQDSTRLFYTDNGYPVYGGGGITPDHFVPLDTSLNNLTFLRLRQQIPAYIFRYLRENPDVADYDELENYLSGFEVDLDAILPALNSKAEAEYEAELPPLPSELRAPLARFFKARLARQLFDSNAYYRILNEDDDIVREALRLMNTADPLAEAREG